MKNNDTTKGYYETFHEPKNIATLQFNSHAAKDVDSNYKKKLTGVLSDKILNVSARVEAIKNEDSLSYHEKQIRLDRVFKDNGGIQDSMQTAEDQLIAMTTVAEGELFTNKAEVSLIDAPLLPAILEKWSDENNHMNLMSNPHTAPLVTKLAKTGLIPDEVGVLNRIDKTHSADAFKAMETAIDGIREVHDLKKNYDNFENSNFDKNSLERVAGLGTIQ